MKKFKAKDRVIHNYLGKATVIKVIKSSMDSTHIAVYLIHADDGELPSEVVEALDNLNEVIDTIRPVSWIPGKYAADLGVEEK